ncbi:MAG: hypothetical protein CMP23_04860 [Rickettsiales bacterium]|nr:hypothetical protein [Rickettsiales bacterium]
MAINLNLELTDLCNIRCRMCGQAEHPKVHRLNPNSFMSWETWKHSVDSLAEVDDEIDLCPHWLGEPCLHPEFDRFIRYAFDSNEDNRLFRHFKLHTNGTLLNEQRIDALLDCANRKDMADDTFRFVHFSVDAFTPQMYENIKKYDLGHTVYKNIVRLLERRTEKDLRWPYVTVAFIVMPENQHEALWFQSYWRRVFEQLDLDYEEVYDWPQRLADTMYFRRLHQEDQAAADQLHREVLDRLDILPLDAPGAFIEESF